MVSIKRDLKTAFQVTWSDDYCDEWACLAPQNGWELGMSADKFVTITKTVTIDKETNVPRLIDEGLRSSLESIKAYVDLVNRVDGVMLNMPLSQYAKFER